MAPKDDSMPIMCWGLERRGWEGYRGFNGVVRERKGKLVKAWFFWGRG
jgi:hypothetical protein